MLAKVERIGSVAALLRERRERLFHEFVELWQSEASKGTWAARGRSSDARISHVWPAMPLVGHWMFTRRFRSFTSFPCSCANSGGDRND